jgi:hypothetical protein
VIVGSYEPLVGPVIHAGLIIEGVPGREFDIDFLVDTGSSATCIMPSDMRRLSAVASNAIVSFLRPTSNIRGVGGSAERWVLQATLVLSHVDGRTTEFDFSLSIVQDARMIGLPSIIGRDVLEVGRFEMVPILERVIFDAPDGAFVF